MHPAISREFHFGSLLRFALPTVIMMIFMSMYTIVDGIFVSRFVGTDALSATNIVYPALNLVLAVAIMLSTGGSAIVARKLGEGDPQGARESFALIVAAGVAAGVVIG
ncbi:MATE family efflux transporter, partial [Anaerotruncus massiliensis (ex Liu et al. 2021)]